MHEWTETTVLAHDENTNRAPDNSLVCRRAVGMACHNNPIGLVVPCHRVVGRAGKLTGYAGGIHIKAWLRSHEGVKTDSVQNRQKRLFA